MGLNNLFIHSAVLTMRVESVYMPGKDSKEYKEVKQSLLTFRLYTPYSP